MPLEPALLAGFSQSFLKLWRQHPIRIGLAVSGGVDSMALASLASLARKNANGDLSNDNTVPNHTRLPAIVGFIVNHKLRAGSTAEASRVAEELKRLDIEPCILPLHWDGHPERSDMTNLESVARTLRYRALGTACRDRNIQHLLFAHHADDQAETVMSRISKGYLGSGLSGIRAEAALPHCNGIYGASESGRPLNTLMKVRGMRIEDGGVTIHRPFLNTFKTDLINVCKSLQTKWFEDETNADKTLTLRNTIRYLLNTENLPVALRPARMLQLSEKTELHERELDQMATDCIKNTVLRFDPRNGTVQLDGVKLVERLNRRIQTETGRFETWKPLASAKLKNSLSAHVVRKMFEMVTPKATVSLQDLDIAVDSISLIGSPGKVVMVPDDPARKNCFVQVGSVHIDFGNNKRRPTLWRASPASLEIQSAVSIISPPLFPVDGNTESMWSDWHLWDGRYWVRLSLPPNCPPQGTDLIIRFLEAADLERLRARLRTQKHPQNSLKSLKRALALATDQLRFTLPVVAVRERGQDPKRWQETKGHVIALPSVSWSSEHWPATDEQDHSFRWNYEIRYKHVERQMRNYA